MDKLLYLFFTVSTFLLFACSKADIIIDDFESGTFEKWKVEGEAFGDAPTQYPEEKMLDNSASGKYYADSFGGDDNLFGTLISNEFKIERNYINFLIGGGTNHEMYIELIVDGESVKKSHSLAPNEKLDRLSWDVKNYRGKSAYIRIVDQAKGGWGHILVDDIFQSNKNKSTIILDYQLSFDVTENYLLVPVEDNAPEVKVQLVAEEENIGVPIDIRIAQSTTDYWIPVDVSSFRGKEVKLLFPFIDQTENGVFQIRQSASFDYEYNETYRPEFHFSPQYGWMNDPNGMVYHNGEYHLFYQYNPYGSRWANMHWGHAVSKDLVSWEHLPFALAPDSLGAIFSGSAVIDKDNTAGFGNDAMIAIYTSAGRIQTQSIAYSLDNGRTFTTYEANPVLSDLNYPDFRDPKVFWHSKTNQWVMSLATGQTISFYGSRDLKEWYKLSEFGEGIGSHAGVWECPDLIELKYNGQSKWVLLVSINPGGPNGGSATQYFIGSFDGKTFNPDPLPYPIWLDYGRDNYAGVTWSNIPDDDGRKIFIGWMNNWDYANHIPSVNFAGAMTLPRNLTLMHNGKHLIVSSQPVKEVDALRGNGTTFETFNVNSSYQIDELIKDNNGTFEIEMVIESKNSSGFNFKLSNEKQERLIFDFNLNDDLFTVDRPESGVVDFSNLFAKSKSEAPLIKRTSYKIRLFVDKLSTECFINDGELVQTNTIFPTAPYNLLSFESDGEISVNSIQVYSINK